MKWKKLQLTKRKQQAEKAETTWVTGLSAAQTGTLTPKEENPGGIFSEVKTPWSFQSKQVRSAQQIEPSTLSQSMLPRNTLWLDSFQWELWGLKGVNSAKLTQLIKEGCKPNPTDSRTSTLLDLGCTTYHNFNLPVQGFVFPIILPKEFSAAV